MKKLYVALLVFALLSLSGCRDSEVASYNVSKDADQFKVERRIVFYNAITDTYILEMTGKCSIEITETGDLLEVTCKTGEDSYQKHFLGLSDNVTFTVEQLGYSNVSEYKYELVFKPESIIPITLDLE